MSKVIGLSDELFGFKKPNEEKAVLHGEIIKTGYDAIEKINSKLRVFCEECASGDREAETVAASVFTGDYFYE